MGIRSKFFVAGSIAFASMAFVSSAHAQGGGNNFATASVASNSAFTLIDNNGTYELDGAYNTAVSYNSLVTTPSTPGGSVAAYLTNFSATNGVFQSFGPAGYGITFTGSASGQIYSGASQTGQNLLSFDFPTTGASGANTNPGTVSVTLFYSAAANQATLYVTANSTQAPPSSSLTDYTSQIYDFNVPDASSPSVITSESFQLGLTSIAGTGTGGSPTTGFTANGTFSFSSTPNPEALPEPSSIAMGLLGAGVGFFPIIRRKCSKS